ncbi:DUF4097 family beta strand repeat-containing protein [Flavihumibacter fluvii]|uniref:DUF4097 family beta strand repeat-containing protein n=1 Tax=Flavihumibacter fluvii TaxID=2838157 RepID=UPI001BDE854C|nr:DUF4097 domain-containing protein [Flavihumibacter fluvii]ULQ53445.1 DUF4097 domain-containing protein [Flavihumibacter fluvii]
MKKILVLGFVLLMGQAYAQDKVGTRPYLSRSLDNEAIRKVQVETSGGNISVMGVDAEARLEVFVLTNNGRESSLSREELQKKLEQDYEMRIAVSNNQLIAIAKPRSFNGNWGRNNLSISFRVYVPKSVSSKLTTSGGNIVLKDLTGGDQDFTTSGGNLSVERTTGSLKGVTSGGNITVIDAKNEIDLSTSGGNIRAERCEGQVKLTTSGGSLYLNQLDGTIRATTSGGSVDGENIIGDLSAHTSGGNIDLDNLCASLETSTSGGNIRISMKSLGKFVKISNSGGNIDLVIPSGKGINVNLKADRIKTSNLENFQGDAEEHHIKGTLNGGGIPVEVHAGGGRISLTLK